MPVAEAPSDQAAARRRLLVALLSAALAFAALAALAGVREPTGIDLAAERFATEHEAGPLVWLADRPLDLLAEPGVVLVLAGAAAIVLTRLGRPRTVLVLLTALALTGFGGTELKEAFDRARPAGNLDEAANQAFPSGHARFSAFWTWLAVAVAAHRGLRRPRRRLLIGAGLAVTALCGLARVYLRAHWLTDVLAGWALSAFAFATAVALVAAAAARRPRPKLRRLGPD